VGDVGRLRAGGREVVGGGKFVFSAEDVSLAPELPEDDLSS